MCLVVFIIDCACIVSANNFAAPFLFTAKNWHLILHEKCKIMSNMIQLKKSETLAKIISNRLYHINFNLVK